MIAMVVVPHIIPQVLSDPKLSRRMGVGDGVERYVDASPGVYACFAIRKRFESC